MALVLDDNLLVSLKTLKRGGRVKRQQTPRPSLLSKAQHADQPVLRPMEGAEHSDTDEEVVEDHSARGQCYFKTSSPPCYTAGALFKQPGGFFLEGCSLVEGSKVVTVDGDTVVDVVRIVRHNVKSLVELCSWDPAFVYDIITPSIRVIVPGGEVCAKDLKCGDPVMCSDGTIRHLANAREKILPESVEMLEITFKPDLAVCVYKAPLAILTKGQKKKPLRRSRMNRRGRPGNARDEGISIPDTAPGLYED